MDDIKTLEDYLTEYGTLLGKQAERALAPLHAPGRDALPKAKLLRQPFEAQAHAIAATVKALGRQKAVLVVAEMGTGKTLLSMAAVHARAAGRPYRALVFCPGQLTGKWEREVLETVPGAKVTQLETWKDVLKLDRGQKAKGAEWFVIARDRAKLGSKWRPAYQTRKYHRAAAIYCPACGNPVKDGDGLLIGPATLARKKHACGACKAPLWQMTGELWRYEPALYIKRRLKGFFDCLILDEVHETKSADTAQGNAAGALAAACGKVIALTGTLIGGYAEHVRPLLFRLSPGSLIREGFTWEAEMPFSEAYGRIEKRVTEREDDGGDDNRQSRGTKKSTTKYVRPGIMPPLFGRHLIDKAVFLSLAEVAANLPPLEEECIPLPMSAAQRDAYDEVEGALADAIKDMVRKGDKRLLGKMVNALLCYPDHPYDWSSIGYHDRGEDGSEGRYVEVVRPQDLPKDLTYPKEYALIELCKKEKSLGRQVWAFVQYTDTRDLLCRLEKMLKAEGLKVGVLRASVSLAKREEWIKKNGPKCDVILSHPKLVETGLDLFDKGGKHNFCTLVFYETGYNLFTLRQASRRAWRIGQKKLCKVAYLYYADSMQSRAMELMGSKMAAARALEGEFSSEGLIAMAGEDAGVEIALARSLAGRMDKSDLRNWKKV